MKTNSQKDLDLEKIKLAYSEMKEYFNFLSEATDKLDGKLSSLFSSLSIILTLFTVLGFDYSSNIHWFRITLLIIIILIFLLFCFMIFQGLIPKKYSYPFDGSLEGVEEVFLNQESLYDVYVKLIVNFKDNISRHTHINYLKNKNLKISFILYLIELLLVVIFIVLPI